MQFDYFDGFPYLLTRVAPSVYHIAVLPAELGFDNLKEIARWQVAANKLDTCLVIGATSCVYFAPSGAESVSDAIPRGGVSVTGYLRLCRSFPPTEDLQRRLKLLDEYVVQKPEGYIFGDLTKGGRRASVDELPHLAHRQPGGVPVGLNRCATCGEWRGECLDPSPEFPGIVMPVRCRCENETLCALCGRPFWDRRVNANFYSEADDQIWHVPGIKAFEHVCAGQVDPEDHVADAQPKTAKTKARPRRMSHIVVKVLGAFACKTILPDGTVEDSYMGLGRHDFEGMMTRGLKRYMRFRDPEGCVCLVDHIDFAIGRSSRTCRRHYTRQQDATTSVAIRAKRTVRTQPRRVAPERRQSRYLGYQTMVGSVMEWRLEYSIHRAISGWIVYIDGEDDCHHEVGPTDAAGIVDGLEEHCLDVAEFATDLESTDDPGLVKLAEDIRELRASASEGEAE